MRKDIRQSTKFAVFMKSLGWQVKKINTSLCYLRKMPLMSNFAKIPRSGEIYPLEEYKNFIRENNIFRLKLAPLVASDSKKSQKKKDNILNSGFTVDMNPFNPTTTIVIDLKKPLDFIFNNFSQAKRRAVRRAVKNNIEVKISSDIESFIKVRQRQYFPFGFLINKETRNVWQSFAPQNAALLLAYQNKIRSHPQHNLARANNCWEKPVAGILLLFYDNIAYYWFASSFKKGKQLFAPTLLVWEALKLAKKRGCAVFDFEGIYDPRFPKAAESWKGFTRFKEGFGGKKIVFMENFYL